MFLPKLIFSSIINEDEKSANHFNLLTYRVFCRNPFSSLAYTYNQYETESMLKCQYSLTNDKDDKPKSIIIVSLTYSKTEKLIN